jgi:hypothetical protein
VAIIALGEAADSAYLGQAVAAVSPGAPESEVIISEFMANKGSSLSARLEGEWVRPDWIEIYNGTDRPVNLEGWYLTDSRGDPTKWRLPRIVIDPDQYEVVFASERDQKYHPTNYPYFDGTRYHANFQLDRAGEYLALVKPDGVTIAHEYAPKYPRQRAFVSYGVCETGGGYAYFQNPTPGSRNDIDCIGDVVADVKFSHGRGFYDAPLLVTITTETEWAHIRYTTDGSAPSETHGQMYRNPISVETTTTLRAMAFRQEWLSTDVQTQTYIFPADVIRQTGAGFPNTWGHRGCDYEMDPVVVSAYAGTIEDDLKSVPTVSLVTDVDSWFGRSEGIYANPDWEDRYEDEAERPVSVEFFDATGAAGQFQIDAVVRIAGGSSTAGWKSDKLSMRLKFQEPWGPTKLDFPLFGDRAADRFDTLVLDARLNNAWNYGRNDTQRRRAQYTRDQFASDVQNALGGHGHHGRHVHLYLNGLYWGLYNLHERPDESFAASYFGGKKMDYDVVKHNENTVVNGSNADYRRMFDIARAGLSSDFQYQTIRRHLDVPDFIDYMITNFYYGNTDWSHHNWYASRNIFDPEGRWRYHSWDAEKGMHGVSDNVTGKDDGYGSPSYLHQRLKSNAEYRRLFADHVHRHFFNDGALTIDNAAALYGHRLDEVDRAVVGESARWVDNRITQGGVRYTRDQHWVIQRNWLLNTYFPRRTDIVLGQLKAKDLYPDIKAPVFDWQGGRDPDRSGLIMTNPNNSGEIYYTTDGVDPREYPTQDAVGTRYARPVTMTESTHIKARVLNGRDWSALNEAIFSVGPVADNLRITEIMYHPDDPNAEFIELKNIGAESLNLNLVRFVDGIDFTFPSVELPAGEHILVVRDTDVFVTQYGVGLRIAGEYLGSLSNAGERVALEDAAGRTILNFEYADDWHDMTDGMGFSLTIQDPAGADLTVWGVKSGWRPSAAAGGSGMGFSLTIQDPAGADLTVWGVKSGWRPSAAAGGSPGFDDVPPETRPIVISEIMYNPASGNQDQEYIELFNAGSSPVTLAKYDDEQLINVPWRLTDSGGISFDFPLAVTMAPGEYLLLVKSMNAFSALYPDVSGTVQIFEWGAGKLDNAGELVQLSKPGEKIGAIRYYMSVDWVDYSDGSHPLGQDPWPADADGHGKSLTRNVISGYGSDPEDWIAAAPSPGR